MTSAIKEIDFTKNPYDVICDLKDLVYRIEKENEELKKNENQEENTRYQTMTKQELTENYTMEQLAEMVVKLKTQERTNDNYTMFLQSKIGDIEAELNRKQTEINQIDEILNKLFGVAHDVANLSGFEKILREKIEKYKKENEELKMENSELHCEIQAMNVFCEGIPTEPIKVADMLINASKKRINCMTEKEYDKYIFEKWQLRQMAEHLLVYCNANGEGEE